MTRRLQPPLLYTDCAYRNLPRKVAVFRWAWSIRDGATGPLLAEGTARTERAAQRHLDRAYGRCVRRQGFVITDRLVNAVLDRFREELAEAGAVQLEHLAERAEGRYSTAIGARMRALVDAERARRADVPVHWGRAVAR